MNWLRRLPIRKKMIAIIMVACVAALILASITFIAYDYIDARNELISSVTAIAHIITDNMVAAVTFEDPKAASDTLDALRSEPSIGAGCVYKQDRLMVQYHAPGQRSCPVDPGRYGSWFDSSNLYVVSPIALEGERIGTVHLRAPLAPMYDRVWREVAILVAIVLISSVIALAISSELERFVSEPFNEMLSQVERGTRQLEQRADELARVNRIKDEFLATLSHELRTPLNAILGWTCLLREGRLPVDRHEAALESVERNARAQAKLIEDLLDVSRIISGKFVLEFVDVDLRQIVAAACEVVHPAADAKHIRLTVRAGTGNVHVSGDAARLQQAVWNVLSNAVKFTPEGGSVEVRIESTEKYARVRVIDNGPGIDRDFLPFVFDRFRQADGSTTRAHGGLGLGLAIVRHIVELHGGLVSAYSAGPGQGSTFTLELPLSGMSALSTGELSRRERVQ